MPSSTKNINTNTPMTKATRKLPISYALPSILISPASQVLHTTNRLEMSGTVGDIPCNWIIDTGVQCTVIVRSLADQAKGDRIQPIFQPHTAGSHSKFANNDSSMYTDFTKRSNYCG